MKTARTVSIWGLGLTVLALAGGCKSEAKVPRKPGSAKGTVTEVDLVNNRFKMRLEQPKSGKEVDAEGSIVPETEVWINGVRKAPADVELNDRVRVEYVRTGDELEQRFNVLRVEVDRPSNWKSTRAATPATEQAPKLVPLTGLKDSDAGLVPATPPAAATTQPAAAPPQPAPQNPADREAQAARLTLDIYAEIRRRYADAVKERAEMIAAGTPASDPKIVERERIIRRARDLLIEHGDNLDPIEPPLPEDGAKTATPTTAPAGS